MAVGRGTHGQQRRQCSSQTSWRSHHVTVGRGTLEVQGEEKLGFRRSRLFSKRRRRSTFGKTPKLNFNFRLHSTEKGFFYMFVEFDFSWQF